MLGLAILALPGHAASAPVIKIAEQPGAVHIVSADTTLDATLIAENILRIEVRTNGRPDSRTPVVNPDLKVHPFAKTNVTTENNNVVLRTAKMRVTIARTAPTSIAVYDATGRMLLEQKAPIQEASEHYAAFLHDIRENLYGMRGLDIRDNSNNLLRNNGATVKSGNQGDGGAPWFFTTHYGVLIDSDGGSFRARDNVIMLNAISRDALEYYVVVGSPLDVMSGFASISGRPPLPPKWTLGFINSQWRSSEAEVRGIVQTYREKHIPLDGFILDFDWKAWGEDHYGEWRWNSGNAPGNHEPNLFPNGASGGFAADLKRQGVNLGGILKPRILLYKPGSTTDFQEPAAYAEAHKLWHPDEPSIVDYVTGRPARDLDFTKAETRDWFWSHLEPAFDSGMTAWWNDEADVTDVRRGQFFDYDNLQFLGMGRMLYEGQRSHSDKRVWSINRSFYAGAQRYGYAEWSGDIETGFASMAQQRARMLATLNLGEPHWSMDSGGFNGHPSPENYARWLEFAAFVPIDRVHGTIDEKRQPWVYGPVAEAAAVKAIRLRYALLPYIYAFEHQATETGVGVVRPMFWMFPNDRDFANETSQWMFGDALLVSPVVIPGERDHRVVLPEGAWYDYARGSRYQGKRTVHLKVNDKTWDDIPIFVREGSILATQPVPNYVGETPVEQVTLDAFPADRLAQFTFYDDDGVSYAYEHGAYFKQAVTVQRKRSRVQLVFSAPEGTFHSALKTYLVVVHGVAAKKAALEGLASVQNGALEWSTGRDRFGPYTQLRVSSGQAVSIALL